MAENDIEKFAKALAKGSFRGFFGFSAKLADGVILGDFHLPITMLQDPYEDPLYLEISRDKDVLLQLLKARNLKRIRAFVKYEDPAFIWDIERLSASKVPFRVSIAAAKYVYGKKTALYALKDSAASLLDGWGVNVLHEHKTVVISLSLPSARLEQGYGKGMNLRKLI